MPKNINQANLVNKRVLLRVDFNIPFDQINKKILDDTRIIQAIPTIKFMMSQGARLIIISHLGRPKNEVDKKQYSFKPLLPYIQKHLPDFEISFLGDLFDLKRLDIQKPKEILLAENIRFYNAELSDHEPHRLEFAQQISKNFDIYVNDAFSVSHRQHASITEIPKFLPSYMGLMFEKEIVQLNLLQKNIKRPYVAIIGGLKVSTKLKTLKSLLKKVDTILVGGAMAYTFLRARALTIGDSFFEKNYLVPAFQIIDEALYYKKDFLLPIDHIVTQEIKDKAKIKIVKRNIPDGFTGVDIGPKTLKKYIKIIRSAKTIFWNGPVGIFEVVKFRYGTIALAREIDKANAQTIVGGGDSIHALKAAGVGDKIDHISVGGGATLEFLGNQNLHGIKALIINEA